MKRSIIISAIALLFNYSLIAQLINNTTFTTPNSGWYQLGYWTANQRGSVRVVVALRGGAHTPQSVIIDAFKNWNYGLHVDIKGIDNTFIEQIRIAESGGNYHIEAYFDRGIVNNGNIHLYALEGAPPGFTLNTGVLPSGGGTIYFESGDIQGMTQIENDVHLTRDLFVDETVGIGTTTTGPHKLAVEGSIGAREVKVESTTWSDFVFREDYELMSINEVENYIRENKHLPNIPTESQVKDEGINLGEMDAKLLQKIEELTLYVIELKQEIDQLKAENHD